MSREGGFPQVNIEVFEGYITGKQAILSELPSVQRISPRVIRILGQNASKMTMQGTNTYMVGTGPKRLIIDTGQGIPEWADLVSCTLATESASLSSVLLTHWHSDHVGGVPSLVGLYSHLNGAIYKHSPCEDQQPITDRQVFHVEGATLRAVHSPGHSHDHMCFVLEEEGAMFTGDNVLGHGSGVYEHLGSWMATLRAMQKYDCAVGYPAHGDVIADLPAKIAGELAQKERRERQILLALAQSRQSEQKGSLTVGQLVAEMHGSRLDSQMQEFALVPFYNETLQKLAGDGKVGFQVRRGQKKWFTLQAT